MEKSKNVQNPKYHIYFIKEREHTKNYYDNKNKKLFNARSTKKLICITFPALNLAISLVVYG